MKAEYTETVLALIAYMENHLTEPSLLTLDRLSAICGYSPYHLLRLFRDAVGLTPAEYTRKRRLTEVIRYISEHDSTFEAAAQLYGFRSKEHFTRAFFAEHHVLPRTYREAQNSLRLYERFTIQPFPMPVCEIREIAPFVVIAYPNTEPEIPQFWNKYNTESVSAALSGGKIVRDYGCMRWNPSENRLDYYIGIRETDMGIPPPPGTVRIVLGGRTYACFTTVPTVQTEFVARIRHTWNSIREWFSLQDEWQRASDFEWECYTEKSRLFSEEICVPITRHGAENDNEYHNTESGGQFL